MRARCRRGVERHPAKPVNLFNYEQRLAKFRSVFALILGELDDALDQVRREREYSTPKGDPEPKKPITPD